METAKVIRHPLVDVRGVPLQVPLAIHFARVDEFQAHKDDLLIATYPKADVEVKKANNMQKELRAYLKYWIFVIIYVARNPKDNVVSYFHFDRMNLSQPEPGPWPEYLQMFMKGELGWGSWYDHVKGYWREKEKNKNILYLFYEDMKEDPAREVLRIAEFLGKPLSKSVVDGIVHLTTFESMRDNPMANYSTVPDTVFDRKVSEFLRKGMVGDWQNLFSPEEDAVFEEHYYRMMADAPIPFRFYLN